MRLLHRLRQERDIPEAHVITFETWFVLCPQCLECHQVFIGDAPAFLESRCAQGVELLLHPSRPNAENHAAVGQNVDGGYDLRRVHRAAMGNDRHRRQQACRRIDGGDVCQQRELIEAGAGGRAGELSGRGVGIAGIDGPRHHHVVGNRQV
jgi:hypothetical protein